MVEKFGLNPNQVAAARFSFTLPVSGSRGLRGCRELREGLRGYAGFSVREIFTTETLSSQSSEKFF